MKIRYLLLLPAAVWLVQVGSAIASAPSFHAPTAAPAVAQTSPASDRPNEIPAPPWARDLNLSAEQRSRLKTVNEQARQEGEALHQKLMEAEKQLRSLLQSDASLQALREQHQQVQQLRQQLDDNHFEALLSERQVLTPEQLAKVIQAVRDRP